LEAHRVWSTSEPSQARAHPTRPGYEDELLEPLGLLDEPLGPLEPLE
jgi:hypothetical protein